MDLNSRYVRESISYETALFERELYFKIHDSCLELNFYAFSEALSKVTAKNQDNELRPYVYSPPEEHAYSLIQNGRYKRPRNFIDIENAGKGYSGHSFVFTLVLGFSTFIKERRPDEHDYNKVFNTFSTMLDELFKCGFRPCVDTIRFLTNHINSNLVSFNNHGKQVGPAACQGFAKLSASKKREYVLKYGTRLYDYKDHDKSSRPYIFHDVMIKDRWGHARTKGLSEDYDACDSYYGSALYEAMKLLRENMLNYEYNKNTPWLDFDSYTPSEKKPCSLNFYTLEDNMKEEMQRNSTEVLAFVSDVLKNLPQREIHADAEEIFEARKELNGDERDRCVYLDINTDSDMEM